MIDFLTHMAAFVAGICAKIIGGVIRHRLIKRSDASDLERAEKSRFDALSGEIPDVIDRIRSQLAVGENSLVQEVVVSPSEGIQLPAEKRRIYCYESQHEQLHEKLDRLVQEGYLEEVGTGNARILKMSRHFLSHVRPAGH